MEDETIDTSHWLPDKTPVILPEQAGAIVAIDGDKGGRQYYSLGSPLEFYVAKRIITGQQYRAGKRLHALWKKGTQNPIVQVQYRDSDGGAKETSFVPLGMAAGEFRDALYSITDKDARAVVRSVCCEDMFAGKHFDGSTPRTAKRHGIAALKKALDILVTYFKYDQQ